MEVIFRKATENDFRESEELTREAFWDLYKPGCDEHYILHKIRKSECYLNELDIVATEGERIIGHIICTKALVIDSLGIKHEVLCVGPLSILPELQRKGHGSKLMEHCIKKASDLGYSGMILFGNPPYYHRFGFRNAAEFQISTKEGLNFDPFMAKELQQNGFAKMQGKFFEDEAFSVAEPELNEFERQFPYREKHITSTQLKN
jgi:predicted N-acetyltransferase YhbS